MTTLTALRRRILECPWDDGLRFIFADALEEADAEESVRHANIIRNTPEPRDEWNIGAALCICQTRGDFVSRLIGVGSAVVRLGFVETISLPLSDFMRHAGELFKAHPITTVAITNLSSFLDASHSWRNASWPTGIDQFAAPHDVPKCVWKLINGKTLGHWKKFESGDAAHAALSAAAVTYGRLAAGLPPLAAPVGV